MTPEELEAIEARANAATPAPWEAVTDDHGSAGIDVSIWSDDIGYYVTEKITSNEPRSDAEFVAHARTDVPALVAEVRRLHAALARADAVMRKALAEVEHQEVVYILDTYLSTRGGGS